MCIHVIVIVMLSRTSTGLLQWLLTLKRHLEGMQYRHSIEFTETKTP